MNTPAPLDAIPLPPLTDAEYVLALIDETFAAVPEIKAHHDRMRKIASGLAAQAAASPANASTAPQAAGIVTIRVDGTPRKVVWLYICGLDLPVGTLLYAAPNTAAPEEAGRQEVRE